MASVTVRNRTYSDDADPVTGLDDGGHVTRLIPLFADAIGEITDLMALTTETGFAWAFSTATAAADPGPGLLALNASTTAATTAIYADILNVAGADVSPWLALMNAGSGAVKGRLRLRSLQTSGKWAEFNVTGATNSTGYFTIAVSYITGAGAAFTAGEAIGLASTATGPAGVVSAAGDGTASAPGISYASETGLGFRRKSAALIALTASGADLLELRPATTPEAQAGANTLALMTPATTASAIQAIAPGSGGQTTSGDLTLTAATLGAVTATPPAPGYYLTLPAANLCRLGAGIVSVFNAGDFDFGVRDSTGTKLGWIPPRGWASIDLTANGTAAGTWNVNGALKLGVTANYVTPASLGGMLHVRPVELPGGKTLLLFWTLALYGAVYDPATKTWGAPVAIRTLNAPNSVMGVASLALTASTALIVTCPATDTALQGVVLSITGTTITVNTAASATLAGGLSWLDSSSQVIGAFGQLIAVGASFVVSYGRATTTSAIRALTVTGTTVAIGAETAVQAGYDAPAKLFAAGSVLRSVSLTTATGSIQAKPYTVSGTALTAGTAATGPTINSAVGFKALLNSNGNIVVLSIVTIVTATIFKLTTTTEAASTIATGVGADVTTTDAADLTGGRVLLAGTSGTYQILIDTAGAASVGATLPTNIGGNVAIIAASATQARVFLSWVTTNNAQLVLDVSTNTPVLSAMQSTNGRDVSFSGSRGIDIFGRRSASLLTVGAATYILNNTTQTGTNVTSAALACTSAGLFRTPTPTSGQSMPATAGASASEAWLIDNLPILAMGAIGVTGQLNQPKGASKWECAA